MHLQTHLGIVLCKTAAAFYVDGVTNENCSLKVLEIKMCYLGKHLCTEVCIFCQTMLAFL